MPSNPMAAVFKGAQDRSYRMTGPFAPQRAMTGLWCENVPDVAHLVPEHPTEAQAKAALLAIRRVFRTFCFADAVTIMENGNACVDMKVPPGLDELSFLARLQTAVCRPEPMAGTRRAAVGAFDVRAPAPARDSLPAVSVRLRSGHSHLPRLSGMGRR